MQIALPIEASDELASAEEPVPDVSAFYRPHTLFQHLGDLNC